MKLEKAAVFIYIRLRAERAEKSRVLNYCFSDVFRFRGNFDLYLLYAIVLCIFFLGTCNNYFCQRKLDQNVVDVCARSAQQN